MSLNVLRWISAWIILIPFTYKEILQNLAYIKKNILIGASDFRKDGCAIGY